MPTKYPPVAPVIRANPCAPEAKIGAPRNPNKRYVANVVKPNEAP